MATTFNEIAIFSGNGHPALAEEICSHMGIKLGDCDVFQFSNEEVFVRYLDNVRERDVFIVQPIVSPVNTSLMELFIMIDAARRASAGRITAVVPYYAYGRSDKKDQPRIPITARLVANFIETAGADRLLSMDMHAGQIQGFFNVPVDELTAFPLLADYFGSISQLSPVVVAPDSGRAKMARDLSERIGGDFAIVDKQRTGNNEVAEAMNLVGSVEGRDCLVLDDEILTGGTIAAAVDTARANGARTVRVACVHPVFAARAYELLDHQDAGIDEIIFTDTLPLVRGEFQSVPQKTISIAPLLGDAINRIHSGGSVGALFNK
ncbi:MAG: ribose-phosphate pyrophosphokinase [Dehalococcoidia bacterium]|nr:ribose-phosphate pyrophosphokinase [Dehalococcoidia bacterium]